MSTQPQDWTAEEFAAVFPAPNAETRTPMPAAELVFGDRISGTFLPSLTWRYADVRYAEEQNVGNQRWVLVVYRTDDGYLFAENFAAGALVPLIRLGDRARTTACGQAKPDTLLEPLGRACDPAYSPATTDTT